MRARTAATTLLALALLTAGCSSSGDAKPDTAACKTAMRKQLSDAMAAGETAAPGTRPAACEGVDSATLQKYAADLMTEQLGKSLESALPTPSDEPAAADGLTDDCRAWITSELLDDSESIDATSGAQVCGDMSSAELDAAIQKVTDELATEKP
ncbi:hypothetical protein [Streptomyces sp. NPDC093676]|uniref:hypothetical protein n=1 Tax=Streptomyces sp. NPDC093676 TaxID=3366050 RepID=UPI0037F83849